MVSKCPKAACENCLMRQPTLESAGGFDKDNPEHWECAAGNDSFPDGAVVCMDYVMDLT